MATISTTRILLGAVAIVSLICGAIVASQYSGTAPSVEPSSQASTIVDLGGQRFLRWHAPRELPSLTFQDGDGSTLSLADFRGRWVLLNIWATWCPPCVKEMPSLDRLNAKRGGVTFEVVALSIDTDPAAVKRFYQETGIRTLREYFDPNARASAALGAFAVPVTLLINQEGKEVGRALGPAEWDSAAVESLIDSVSSSPPGEKTSCKAQSNNLHC